MSYICKESDILYIDKELFTYENKAFSERYTALYRDGHSQATHESPKLGDDRGQRSAERRLLPEGRKNEGKTSSGSDPQPPNLGGSFKGVPYSEIIAEWWRQNGGEPQEGERNVKLYQLSDHATLGPQ